MSFVGRAGCLLILCFYIHEPLKAVQDQEAGSLQGTVVDPRGKPIPGAHVKLEHKAGKKKLTYTCNEAGEFAFSGLPAGAYTLSASAKGFEEERRTVEAGTPSARPLRIRLGVAEISEEVTVTANLSSSPSAEQNIDAIQIDQNWLRSLPSKDADPLSVPSIFLDPAASGYGGAKLIVDGVEGSALDIPALSIAGVYVNRNPYTAEFAEPGKGRIEVITRRGSRKNYRGNLSLVLRNSALEARNAFAKTKPLLQRAVPELDFYGPLGQKLTFYLAGKYYVNNERAIIHAVTPSGPFVENFKSPDRGAYLLGRFDYRFNPAEKLVLSYGFRNKSTRGQGVGGFNLPERATDSFGRGNDLKLAQLSTLSSSLINELRLAWKSGTERSDGLVDTPAIIVLDAFNTGGSQVSRRSRETSADLQDLVSLVKGRHAMRFGGGFRPRFFRVREASNFGGTFTFSNLARLTEGRPFLFKVNEGDPEVSFSQHEFYVFFQDEIRIVPNLSVSLGLRHEVQSNLADRNNFGPRLAFAYSPGGQRTVLRGGIGVFYDRLSWKMRQDSLLYDGARIRQLVVANPGFPMPWDEDARLSITPPSVIRIAPGIRAPYRTQASLSIERQFSHHSNYVKLEYTTIRGVKLYRMRNVNAPLPLTGIRPDPNFVNIDQYESSATSRTHGLTATYQGRVRRRFNLISQYTLSKTVNDTGGSLPANNYDLRGERGRADFDQRHRFNLVGIFDLPFNSTFSCILNLSSGAPFDITTGYDDNLDTVANDRPPGVGRNTGNGSGRANVDTRLAKRFQLEGNKRKLKMEVGIDAFNVFNHVNLKNFVGTLSSPLFGRANASHAARQLQASLRFYF